MYAAPSRFGPPEYRFVHPTSHNSAPVNHSDLAQSALSFRKRPPHTLLAMTLRVFSRRFLIPARGAKHARRSIPAISSADRCFHASAHDGAPDHDAGPREQQQARDGAVAEQAVAPRVPPHLAFFSSAQARSRFAGNSSAEGSSRGDASADARIDGQGGVRQLAAASSSSLTTRDAARFSKSHQRFIQPPHPLLTRLTSLLHSETGTATSEEVWKAYIDLHLFHAYGDANASTLNLTLSPALHSHALRAMTPDWTRRKEAKRESRITRDWAGHELARSVEQQDLADSTAHAARSNSKGPRHYRDDPPDATNSPFGQDSQRITFRTYEDRADFVFKQMTATSSQLDLDVARAVPSLQDVAFFLSKAALNGSINAVNKAYGLFTSKYAQLEAMQAQSRGMTDAHFQRLLHDSYKYLMLGLVRHAARGVSRSRHSNGQLQQLLRDQQPADQGAQASTASNNVRRNQERARRQAQGFIELNTQRALLLLSQMQSRGLTPRGRVLGLATRCFRYEHGLTKLYTFVQTAFGVDLRNFDDPYGHSEGRSASLPPHTLNTILMALGEQSTASRMMATYEVLVRPLHVNTLATRGSPSDDRGAASRSESLFQTDFAGVFTSLKEREHAELTEIIGLGDTDAGASSALPVSSHPHWLQPTNSTYTTLLKYLCSAIEPFSVGFVHARGTELTKEDEKRAKGHYAPLARYLIREQLDAYQDEVVKLATALGVGSPDFGEDLSDVLQSASKLRQSLDVLDQRIEESKAEDGGAMGKLMQRRKGREEKLERLCAMLEDPQVGSATIDASEPESQDVNLRLAALQGTQLMPVLFATPALFWSYAGMASHLRSTYEMSWLVDQIGWALYIARAHRNVLRAASERYSALRAHVRSSSVLLEGVQGAQVSARNLRALNSLLHDVERTMDDLTGRIEALESEEAQRTARLISLRRRRRVNQIKRSLVHSHERELERKRVEWAELSRKEKQESERIRRELGGSIGGASRAGSVDGDEQAIVEGRLRSA
ncbi:hypothetical protein IE81DRAFT_320040 [Ceraceosorus guamensis]|uniref:Uncharacterized protein n=1 Tax=Ceraceosorus guamensis TaxID=1522189 RepID=A0A316W741_9BASI|nr:hypothetical protein IE81DRAFT_320040 [Ceraceosorus guamensis]PWN45740.1 hypothetical protein IE81DRAFT_320040 [Ceraceosorus guamensis]